MHSYGNGPELISHRLDPEAIRQVDHSQSHQRFAHAHRPILRLSLDRLSISAMISSQSQRPQIRTIPLRTFFRRPHSREDILLHDAPAIISGCFQFLEHSGEIDIAFA